jgi:hypothetical protein
LLFAIVVPGARADPLSLEATELFLHYRGELRQVVLVAGAPPAGPLVVVSPAGRVTFEASDLPRFMNRLVVPVAPTRGIERIRVEMPVLGRSAEIELHEARRWEVFVVPHTHLDIGFTDLPERVWAAAADDVNRVIDLCAETDGWPEGSRFHWTIEGTALFENFAARYPEERVKRLVDRIREGRIELSGMWANLLTELCGPEALLRAFYPSRRISERYGIRIDTVMINDVPGYTWSLPQILSQLGVRYANLHASGIRGNFVWDRPGAVPRPFRWESPDGAHVVCWYTDSSFLEGAFLYRPFTDEPGPDLEKALYLGVTKPLRRARDAGSTREDIQLRRGGDNLGPARSASEWVRYWNARWPGRVCGSPPAGSSSRLAADGRAILSSRRHPHGRTAPHRPRRRPGLPHRYDGRCAGSPVSSGWTRSPMMRRPLRRYSGAPPLRRAHLGREPRAVRRRQRAARWAMGPQARLRRACPRGAGCRGAALEARPLAVGEVSSRQPGRLEQSLLAAIRYHPGSGRCGPRSLRPSRLAGKRRSGPAGWRGCLARRRARRPAARVCRVRDRAGIASP